MAMMMVGTDLHIIVQNWFEDLRRLVPTGQ